MRTTCIPILKNAIVPQFGAVQPWLTTLQYRGDILYQVRILYTGNVVYDHLGKRLHGFMSFMRETTSILY